MYGGRTSKQIGNSLTELVTRANSNTQSSPPADSNVVTPGVYDLALHLIVTDGGTQSRAFINSDVVAEYAEAMEGGALFPTLTVFYDGERYWLADGFHRVAAAKKLGWKKLLCDVRQGTQRDAVLFSLGANAHHGLRRTNDDKRRAVTRLLQDSEWQQWSDNRIAKACGVSQPYVSKLRGEIDPSYNGYKMRKATRSGTTYEMNTAGITASAKEAAKALTEQRREVRETKLAEALATASPAVVEIVGRGGVDDPDTVQILKRLEKERRESFAEVQQSGYIQPGEAEKAVHISEGALKVQQALYAKSDVHRSMAMDNRPGVPPALMSSASNEWYTPAVYVDAARELMGGIDVDPASCEFANRTVKAAQYFTIDDDGLTKPWAGRVWLNPPYGRADGESNQSAWTKRLLQQYREGCTTEAVLLVNAVTDRSWFQPLWQFAICFVSQRIRFISADGEGNQPTHGNALVYLGGNKDGFVNIFSEFGPVVTHVIGQKVV